MHNRRVIGAAAFAFAIACGRAFAAPGGDVAFRAGDFDAAAVAWDATLRDTPDDVAALRGLATVALYRNRLDEALRLANAALARDPNDPRAHRVVALVQARRGAPGAYDVTQPKEALTIPFVATDPLPVLRVRVNDQRDALFFIDTGAPDVVIDPEVAAALHAPAADAGVGTFAGGAQAQVQRTTLSALTVGGLRVASVPALILPTRTFELVPGQHIDGILGTGFLYRFLATIDYARGTLVLRARSSSASFESAADGAGSTVVPMWFVGDHFIFVRARLGNGPLGLFNVDTGLAGGGLMATKATLDAAHVQLEEADSFNGQGGGGPVRTVPFRASATLGGLTVSDVRGFYTPGGDQYGIFSFDVAGTLSHGFFRAYAVTFDFDAMRLVVAP